MQFSIDKCAMCVITQGEMIKFDKSEKKSIRSHIGERYTYLNMKHYVGEIWSCRRKLEETVAATNKRLL